MEVRNILDTTLEQLLPTDFTLRRDMVVNGQTVPFLAISPIHGAVAVFIHDVTGYLKAIIDNENPSKSYLSGDEKKRAINFMTNAAERFKSAVAVPETLYLPEAKYVCGATTVNNRGLLILNVIVNITSFRCLKSYLLDNKEIAEKYCFINGVAPKADIEKYVCDFLENEKVVAGVEWVNRNISIWFSSEGISKSNPDRLNAKQKELVRSSTSSGYRRIKGAAGSGKSLVLAARGARLLTEGKHVLFLTYNIVASRYLNEKAAEILAHLGRCLDGSYAEFLHFHGLLRKIVPWNPPKDQEEEYLNFGWCNEAVTKLKEGEHQRYDAILVDEGQDFCPKWWEVVLLLIKKGGEVLLAADRSQNVYSRAPWTESAMNGAGFHGPWSELRGSYRMPDQFIVHARDFIIRFLSENDCILPEAPKDRQGRFAGKLHMHWIQLAADTHPEDAASLAFREYLRLKDESTAAEESRALQNEDVAFLVCTNTCGHALENEFFLQDTMFYSAIGNRDAKLGFSMRCPGLKISTVKSFKGLEARALIVVAELGMPATELYVAMTRVLELIDRDSFLTVLCLDGNYADYGKSWAQKGMFEDWTGRDASHLAKNVIIGRYQDAEDVLIDRDFFNVVMNHANATGEIDNACGSQGQKILNVNTNVNNTREQNIAYLHDYFFRSYTENLVFWQNMLANLAYAAHLRKKASLNVLFYGCGTGGDIAGFLDALDKSCVFSEKVVTVYAVDCNKNALGICWRIINGLRDFRQYDIMPRLKTVDCRAGKNGFPLPLGLPKRVFDVIETSKMINEIIELNYGSYFGFLDTIVKPFLKDDGLALIADVPVKRHTRREKEQGVPVDRVQAEWTPKLMAEAVYNFTRKNQDFSVVLPVVCDGCKAYCYSAKLYAYKFFDSDILVQSPVCCRLLAREKLRNILRANNDDEGYFITCFRKDGSTTCCRKQGVEKNVQSQDAEDGYILR